MNNVAVNLGIKATLVTALLLIVSITTAKSQTNIILPFIKIRSITYSNVTVTKINPLDARVTDAYGSFNVAMTNLPPAIQSQLHYDLGAASKLIAQRKALAQQQALEKEKQRQAALRQWQAAITNSIQIMIVKHDPAIQGKFTAIINHRRQDIILLGAPAWLYEELRDFELDETANEAEFTSAILNGHAADANQAVENGRTLLQARSPQVFAFRSKVTLHGLPVWQYVRP